MWHGHLARGGGTPPQADVPVVGVNMLTFFNGGTGRYCDGLSRRSFLKVGALAVGGLAMPDLLKLRAQAAASNPARRPKSVIMVWLRGGASHIDVERTDDRRLD